MKRCTILFSALLLASPAALAYQVTGPVLEVTDSKIVVEKNKEKWEVERDKDTKVTGGELKKGSRVTIQYRMTATSVEVKDGGKSKDSKEKDKSKDKDKTQAKEKDKSAAKK